MINQRQDEYGLGLIEVLIATFLIGIIASMMLPSLMLGLEMSARQSVAATATRYMNELVESARSGGDCNAVLSAPVTNPAPPRVTLTTWTVEDDSGVNVSDCSVVGAPQEEIVSVRVSVSDAANSDVVASTTVLIFVP